MSPILGARGGLSASAYGLFAPSLAGTNSYESIQTVTVGSGGQATASFTSIPGTYKHLQIRMFANSSGADNANVTFNSDTGNNYTRHRLAGNGSTATSSGGTSLPGWYIFSTAGFPSGSGYFGPSVVDILDYTNTNKYTTGRAASGQVNTANGGVEITSGLWLNTAAITRIDITAFGGSWAQYSSFALYGIKG
jgi:hypothetical protein